MALADTSRRDSCNGLIILQAGELTCLYAEGSIRKLKLGETELIRNIYAAVRNRNWDTIAPVIHHEKIDSDEHTFRVEMDCSYILNEIDFQALIVITGNADNSVTFSFDGMARTDFDKNRIGICVNHPIRECAGKDCRIITPGGEEYHARFPVEISPHQPFRNIQQMTWQPAEQVNGTLQFSGEVFETEDQRNWTDASYKTYCTPLDIPFPVRIKQGEKVVQTVDFRLSGPVAAGKAKDDLLTFRIQNEMPSQPFPGIGVSSSSEVKHLGESDQSVIREAGFDHYRIEVNLFSKEWFNEYDRDSKEAESLGLPVELVLIFSDDFRTEIKDFIASAESIKAGIKRILVYTESHLNSDELSGYVIPLLKGRFSSAPVGTGTNAHFAELNRNRPDPVNPDLISWPVCPQVHAFDHLSLVENLAAQKDTVTSIRKLYPDKTICISPVTLRQRFNVVATGDEAQSPEGQLPSRVDVRQPTQFCVSWTAGSLKYLSESGVSSITYYETAGREGIIHGDHQPLSPDQFDAGKGDIYPLYYFFRELLRFKDYTVIPSLSSNPGQFDCLYLLNDLKPLLILISLCESIIKVHFPDKFTPEKAWILDQETLPDLVSGKNIWRHLKNKKIIELNPYSVVFAEAVLI